MSRSMKDIRDRGSMTERSSMRSSASGYSRSDVAPRPLRQVMSARGSITSSALASVPEAPRAPLRPGEHGDRRRPDQATASERSAQGGPSPFNPIPRQWRPTPAPGSPSSDASVWKTAKGDSRTFGNGKVQPPYRTDEGEDWNNWAGKITQHNPNNKDVFRADVPDVFVHRQRNKKVLINAAGKNCTIAETMDHINPSMGRAKTTKFAYVEDGSAGVPVAIEKSRNMRQAHGHPAKMSVIDTVVFNHDLDNSGHHYMDNKEIEGLSGFKGAAGTSQFFERVRGTKKAHGMPATKSQVDNVVFNHDIECYDHEAGVKQFNAIHGGSAGKDAWTEGKSGLKKISGSPAEAAVVGNIVFDQKKGTSDAANDDIHIPRAPFTDLLEGASGKAQWDQVRRPKKHFHGASATRSRFGKVVYGRDMGSEEARAQEKAAVLGSEAGSSTAWHEERPRGRKPVRHAIAAKTEFAATAFGQDHKDHYQHLDNVSDQPSGADDRNYAGTCSHHHGRRIQRGHGITRTHHDDKAAHHGHHRHAARGKAA